MTDRKKDPATGICDECTKRLADNHFLRGTGLVKDRSGLRHVIGKDFDAVSGKRQTACRLNLAELTKET